MEAALVINADLGPLHRVGLKHAIRMLLRNSWTNTVAACGGCNQRKGDRTPAEARMPLRGTPAAPSWAALAQR